MPWGLTPAHLIIILVIVLIVVGPGKLPDTGAAIGKALRGFKDAMRPVSRRPSSRPRRLSRSRRRLPTSSRSTRCRLLTSSSTRPSSTRPRRRSSSTRRRRRSSSRTLPSSPTFKRRTRRRCPLSPSRRPWDSPHQSPRSRSPQRRRSSRPTRDSRGITHAPPATGSAARGRSVLLGSAVFGMARAPVGRPARTPHTEHGQRHADRDQHQRNREVRRRIRRRTRPNGATCG